MSTLPRVLVVDDSRMVRVVLVKHLQGQYEVREESDGEAAWQALVLDHSIKAVISDLQMPKLNGYQLLEKVRTSRLRRLQELPFILVSGEETEEDRVRARKLGVSDFLTKGAGSSEVLTRLNHLLALSDARSTLDAERERLVQDPASGLFTMKYLELQAAQALSHAARHDGEASVMVLGFDAFEALGKKLGDDAAAQVALRFAKMLGGKIRQEDSLGHFGAGQFAIVSPGTSPALCASFAERVREAVEVAHVAVQGQPLSLTVSIGVASVPGDRVTSAGALLELAGQRMHEAMQAGGNRIVSGGQGAAAVRRLSLTHALELLAANRRDAVLPHLGELGRQIAPLLQLMDQELGLSLPLAEIEHRLSELVKKQ